MKSNELAVARTGGIPTVGVENGRMCVFHCGVQHASCLLSSQKKWKN